MENGLLRNLILFDRQNKLDFFDELTHALQATIIVFLVTAVMMLIGRPILGEGVIAMIYLIPIGWCTVRWGRLSGVSAALTAGLAFDYCFIPPFYSFTVGSIEGWLILIFFVAASVLIVGRIQALLLTETKSKREAVVLCELANAVSGLQTNEAIARVVAEKIQELYLASMVQVDFYNQEKIPTIVTSAKGGRQTEGWPDLVLSIWGDARILGTVTIWQGLLPLPAEQDNLVQAFLRQTARAILRLEPGSGLTDAPDTHPEQGAAALNLDEE
jgi:K+-sensing histidine kinase KdpD